MNSKKHTDVPLAERLRKRAEALRPDKQPPVIRKIIEVRSVIAQERLRGRSWNALSDLLKAEGIHLTPGTLRNYMALIGQAETALRDAGTLSPGDDDIHAALRHPVSRPRTAAPTPGRLPVAPVQVGRRPPSVATDRSRSAAAPPARASLTRNPDRDL